MSDNWAHQALARGLIRVFELTNRGDSRMIGNVETICLHTATSPSGKARVCKTLIMGSNPIVASKNKRFAEKFR
jgi:hypothetical protein